VIQKLQSKAYHTVEIDVYMRILGSVSVIAAYFIVLHVNLLLGVVIHFIADLISIPYFVRTKSWDVVIMLTFLLAISLSKLVS
jgi:hypothetical protein